MSARTTIPDYVISHTREALQAEIDRSGYLTCAWCDRAIDGRMGVTTTGKPIHAGSCAVAS